MILCDTNILIESFKGDSKTIKILEKIGFSNITISSITSMELYFGALNKSKIEKIKKNLRSIKILHLNESISEIALNLIYSYSKSHNLNIPDALIAATAICYGFNLFTYNLKDFKFITGLKFLKF